MIGSDAHIVPRRQLVLGRVGVAGRVAPAREALLYVIGRHHHASGCVLVWLLAE